MAGVSSQNDPTRALDWRRAEARRRVDAGRVFLPGRFDPYVEQLRRYLRKRKMATTELARRHLAEQMPAVDMAFRIYEASQQACRDEIEARILAGQSCATIAQEVNLEEPAVMVYAAAFFDVTDRLDRAEFILGEVVFSGRSEDATGRGTFLKLVAYAEGSEALEEALGPSNVSGLARLQRGIQQESRLLMAERSLKVIRSLDIRDRHIIADLLKTWTMRERNGKPGDDQPDSWQERFQAMLKMLPLQVRGRGPGETDPELARFTRTAVELNPQEKLLVMTGHEHPDAEELLGLQYPPRPTASTAQVAVSLPTRGSSADASASSGQEARADSAQERSIPESIRTPPGPQQQNSAALTQPSAGPAINQAQQDQLDRERRRASRRTRDRGP